MTSQVVLHFSQITVGRYPDGKHTGRPGGRPAEKCEPESSEPKVSRFRQTESAAHVAFAESALQADFWPISGGGGPKRTTPSYAWMEERNAPAWRGASERRCPEGSRPTYVLDRLRWWLTP